ncbi:hypothetical protein RFI_01051 [Reticulomyxa filosa]|uniref:Uncharacterized protein n=1 Tax=Reticulomyxa filosa TaxID=46433 RepID=X6PCS4_RETFI|nr:hypothetical protein RFI_01051 [Reticulomyxa filosa]|eukprot:ETO36011.1 hypothetical protein RFI_01051 [Reticulomyxa filosa]
MIFIFIRSCIICFFFKLFLIFYFLISFSKITLHIRIIAFISSIKNIKIFFLYRFSFMRPKMSMIKNFFDKKKKEIFRFFVDYFNVLFLLSQFIFISHLSRFQTFHWTNDLISFFFIIVKHIFNYKCNEAKQEIEQILPNISIDFTFFFALFWSIFCDQQTKYAITFVIFERKIKRAKNEKIPYNSSKFKYSSLGLIIVLNSTTICLFFVIFQKKMIKGIK